MVRRLVGAMAVLAAIVLWSARAVEASPIMTLRPSGTQSGAPGDTLSWGYDLINDTDDDLIFLGMGADVIGSDGTIDVGIFDFFNLTGLVAAHTELHVDYDPVLNFGLVQMTLSTLLSPGQTVVGRVFIDYMLAGAAGVTVGTFELHPTATVADTTPIPEPSTLLLLGTGAAAFLGRRRLLMARG
jgi:hypothetical protein